MLKGRPMRPPYQSRVEGNSLIIESTRDVLTLAGQIAQQMDTREAPADQSPIRFYKVNHVPASELLETIQSINFGGTVPARRGLPERRRTRFDERIPGPNYPPIYGCYDQLRRLCASWNHDHGDANHQRRELLADGLHGYA